MDYYKIIDKNGYIFCVGTGVGGVDITEYEYKTILSVINNRPTAEPGFIYKLRTDLTWELCEVPPIEVDEEATEEDYLSALAELGVTVNDEI